MWCTTPTPPPSPPSLRGELDIAGIVKIPIWTYGKTMEQKLVSMKKMSTAGDGDGEVSMDRQYRWGGRRRGVGCIVLLCMSLEACAGSVRV